jgi:hypothetical protein
VTATRFVVTNRKIRDTDGSLKRQKSSPKRLLDHKWTMKFFIAVIEQVARESESYTLAYTLKDAGSIPQPHTTQD